ncbi:MAG: phosphoribosyl-AMP cyclohydrolase [Candidatus Omnitrophica bacterium]|nr:phosphoribosyl-AMP cyclohydrolase [Candidatus Omnitrophota bacterium]
MKELLGSIKFDDKGLIPAIIQDEKSKEVLTLCYMNKDALLKTLEEGKVYVFRRSKGRLMLKGETSGCVQKVRSLAIDCEGNSILLGVDQERAACHEGYFTCYFRKLKKDGTFEVVGKRIFDPKQVYPAQP